MENISVILVVLLASAVCSLPIEEPGEDNMEYQSQHNVQKRFINPMFSLGASENEGLVKIRTKRSEEECEKLHLCKMHARANRSFFSAFELYFVNKENARLWDHRSRSLADCEQKFGDCYDK